MQRLPRQAGEVPWPTQEWPETSPTSDVDARRLGAAIELLFSPTGATRCGITQALLGIWRGGVVVERYGDGVGPEQTLRSWSMAKSVLHAVVGCLVDDGLLELNAPAAVPAWGQPGDERGTITLEQLLRMVDGLDFVEHYEAGSRSDVIEMLREAKTSDTAAFAEERGLAHPPGSVFNYSSGTSMIVAAIAKRALGGGRKRMEEYMAERLFAPLGMQSALPRFDGAETFIGSSYLFATARDFARFGLLYLRDGVWEDQRIVPAGWVDHARTVTAPSKGEYGAHWWLDVAEAGTFCAKGFQGQYILISPEKDMVVVRLGVSTEPQREYVVEALGEVLASFPTAGD